MPPGNLDGDVVVEPAFLSQDSVVVADAEPRRRRRKRKQREPNLVGRGPCVVVVVIGFDCKEAIPPRRRKVIDEARRRAGLPVEDWSRQGVGATLMLGLVVVPSWEFKATENDVIKKSCYKGIDVACVLVTKLHFCQGNGRFLGGLPLGSQQNWFCHTFTHCKPFLLGFWIFFTFFHFGQVSNRLPIGF
jgi:hypothetical protein